MALTNILLINDSAERQNKLVEFEQKSYQNLNKLAALVRKELPAVNYSILVFHLIYHAHFTSSYTVMFVEH